MKSFASFISLTPALLTHDLMQHTDGVADGEDEEESECPHSPRSAPNAAKPQGNPYA
jgi:hypothetical protein